MPGVSFSLALMPLLLAVQKTFYETISFIISAAMNNQKTLVIFALVAVLGLVAMETVDLILTMQAAEPN
jgi:hypothetical protein